ncbi:hypothetical protein AZE42_12335 [Rhizopogon vesiculosus]|uniref:Uncharacterized protein n=1 Tax=Rhizopogon vesiculosus TaxID=180088 RepID=A0A1J8QKK6_9AGAM|nr:hypothetical protein AZE42_12335 [Rhizopogon vesiculosus]
MSKSAREGRDHAQE